MTYYLLLATHERFFSLFKIRNQQYENEELIINFNTWKDQENKLQKAKNEI